MDMSQGIGTASDRVMAALVSGLELEFGRGAGEALAHRFLKAEEADFRWDARVEERWIATYESADDEDVELERIAICGHLDGKWFCATMIVDGEGQAHGMMDAASSNRWSGRGMRCSMRTDAYGLRGERRRRKALVTSPFLSCEGGKEGREGKQDKGSVSRPALSDCLHIAFSRDRRLAPRDRLPKNGGNPRLLSQNRETPGHLR
jgi:hypothetical protein